MKTAISVGDDLLREADKTAKKLGLSRSRLFCVALERFLRQRRQSEMTEQLNRVYSKPDPDEQRLTALMKAKFRNVVKDPW